MERLPNSAGISPLSPFPKSFRSARLERLPNSGGISPLSPFPYRFSTARLARLPSSAGISPVNPLDCSHSSVTRPSSSVVTPCHSPIGSSLSQFVLSSQPSPPVAS